MTKIQSTNSHRNNAGRKHSLRKGLGATLALAMMASPLAVVTASAAETGAPGTTTDKINITVSNHWVGNEAEYILLDLLADGEKIEEARITQEDGWSYTFTDLAKSDADGDIKYEIKPKDGLVGYKTHVSGDAANGFKVVNLEKSDNPGFQGATIDVDVEKSWVGEAGDKANVVLLVDGLEAGTATLTASGGWVHEFKDLPLTTGDTGGLVTYTIAEENAAGYDTVITGSQDQGFTVSNIKEQDAAVEGSIVTKYVDADGKEIAYRDTVSGEIGKEYKTTSKTIPGYKLKSVTGSEAGLFAAGVSEVIYVYEKLEDKEYTQGNVDVKYVNEKGVEIALRDSYSGEIGKDYAVTAKTINGYKLKSTTGKPTGKFEQGITTVTFVYTEDANSVDAVMGSVVVKYVDKNGVEIANRDRLTGKLGTSYKTTQRAIDGYNFVRVSGTKEGKFNEGITIVEYVYEAVALESRVVAKYVDESGKEISERVNRSGKIGEKYTTEQKKINGYEFVTVRGSANGTYVTEATEVTYVYKQIVDGEGVQGKVVVKHVDEEGNEIASRDMLSGKIGEKYNTSKRNIAGYTFAKTEGSASGTYAEGVSTVLMVYTQNKDAIVTPPTTTVTDTSDVSVGVTKPSQVPVVNTPDAGTNTTNGDSAGGESKTNIINDRYAQDGQPEAAVKAEEKVEGKALANTATNTFNLLALGAGLLVIAGAGLLFVNRRRGVTDTE